MWLASSGAPRAAMQIRAALQTVNVLPKFQLYEHTTPMAGHVGVHNVNTCLAIYLHTQSLCA